MKKCTTCGELKPLSEYHKNPRSADKHAYYCRACVAIRFKQSYELAKKANAQFDPKFKICLDCKLEKPISQFGKKSSALDKHLPYCKPCWRIRTYRARRKANG